MTRNRLCRIHLCALGLLLLAGCSTNPVTGKRELALVDESQELAIGRENYAPSRQAQGGDYVADPKLLAYVQSVGQRLAKVADRPLEYEFRIVNDDTPNAWALPGGKIAVNRGLLLALHSEAELAAVLAHEIVHAAARHSAKSMERGLLLQGAVLAAGVALADTGYQQLGELGANLGANLTKMHYSRDAESEADHYGILYMQRAGYDPHAAVELQQTFVRLSEDKNPGWLAGLFASHPPSPQRVEDNRRQVAALGNPGGELGEKRYREAIAHLKRTEPAYQAYREAQRALQDEQFDKALALVKKAQRIEPNEALFDALAGKIRERQGKPKQALASYDRAVKKNPGYFAPYLARGLLERRQGDVQAAQRDLDVSLSLLPTAEGHYGLGLLAQQAKRPETALQHFRRAAESQSPAGHQAAQRLAKLDLRSNPQRYLKASLRLAKNGLLQIHVENFAVVAVKALRVAVLESQDGIVRQRVVVAVEGPVPAGKSTTLTTDIGPVPPEVLRILRAAVIKAELAG